MSFDWIEKVIDKMVEKLVISCESVVRRAYWDILDREPDSPEVNHYMSMMNTGVTEEILRQELRHSDEGRNRCKLVVLAMYHHYLQREPDDEDAQHWMGKWQRGEISEAGLHIAFMDAAYTARSVSTE